jgi:hypothetical protein
MEARRGPFAKSRCRERLDFYVELQRTALGACRKRLAFQILRHEPLVKANQSPRSRRHDSIGKDSARKVVLNVCFPSHCAVLHSFSLR